MRAWTRDILLGIAGIAIIVLPAVITFAKASPSMTGFAGVVDGDDILIGGQDFRLRDIDALESGQTCKDAAGVDHPCGKEATSALHALVKGEQVTCTETGDTDGDRKIAMCTVGTTDIGTEMVRLGWAFVRPDFAKGRSKALCAIEADAARAKRGAWQYTFELPFFVKNGTTKTRDQVSCGNA